MGDGDVAIDHAKHAHANELVHRRQIALWRKGSQRVDVGAFADDCQRLQQATRAQIEARDARDHRVGEALRRVLIVERGVAQALKLLDVERKEEATVRLRGGLTWLAIAKCDQRIGLTQTGERHRSAAGMGIGHTRPHALRGHQQHAGKVLIQNSIEREQRECIAAMKVVQEDDDLSVAIRCAQGRCQRSAHSRRPRGAWKTNQAAWILQLFEPGSGQWRIKRGNARGVFNAREFNAEQRGDDRLDRVIGHMRQARMRARVDDHIRHRLCTRGHLTHQARLADTCVADDS